MGSLLYLLTVFMLFAAEINSAEGRNDGRALSRRKRYVAFPDGTTMIWAFCMTTQTILPMGIFTEGVNWGVAYDLPNKTTFAQYLDKDNYANLGLKRRHRRDLYSKAELIMDSMGFNGRSCILRALCEASRLPVKSPTLSESLVRLLFKFPGYRMSHFEPEEHRLYHSAYQSGRKDKQQECHEMFAKCSISLVDLALGLYGDYSQENTNNNLFMK